VLIDRRFSREYPIQADYVGRAIDTFPNQKVMVNLNNKVKEESVELWEA
jgi:pyrimidine operon attenuation protein/uracil phosphoribosyltransferase